MKKILFILLTPLWALTIQVTPSVITQGQSAMVTVRSTVPVDKITFQNKNIPLYFITANRYETFIGTAYNTPTGTYTIRCGEQKKLLAIRPGKFQIGTIVVPSAKQKEGATDLQVLSKETEIIGAAFRSQAKTKYWQGLFVRPLKQYLRISSPYGAQRKYVSEKGELISEWAHRGVDYAVFAGNMVYAANTGRITVSEEFQVHGNTLIIDHGQGVLSVYNHLDRLLVKNGDLVKKGQVIAYSGNTGLSSGPHVHYGLSVNNVRVNPYEWFKKVW
jgi:lysostaphin